MSTGVTSEPAENALKPLASVDGEAAFDEPWQAEALAIADTLVQSGMFSAVARLTPAAIPTLSPV